MNNLGKVVLENVAGGTLEGVSDGHQAAFEMQRLKWEAPLCDNEIVLEFHGSLHYDFGSGHFTVSILDSLDAKRGWFSADIHLQLPREMLRPHCDVNWSSIGSQKPEIARSCAQVMLVAAGLAEKLLVLLQEGAAALDKKRKER